MVLVLGEALKFAIQLSTIVIEFGSDQLGWYLYHAFGLNWGAIACVPNVSLIEGVGLLFRFPQQ